MLLPAIRDGHKRQPGLPHNHPVRCANRTRGLRLGNAMIDKVARPGLRQSVGIQIGRRQRRLLHQLPVLGRRSQFPGQGIYLVQVFDLGILFWRPDNLIRIPALLLEQVLLNPALDLLLVRQMGVVVVVVVIVGAPMMVLPMMMVIVV